MKLYKIWQTENSDYDTYDSAIVAAKNEDEARLIHPDGDGVLRNYNWTTPEHVHVELIGTAVKGTKAGVIVASFNAG